METSEVIELFSILVNEPNSFTFTEAALDDLRRDVFKGTYVAQIAMAINTHVNLLDIALKGDRLVVRIDENYLTMGIGDSIGRDKGEISEITHHGRDADGSPIKIWDLTRNFGTVWINDVRIDYVDSSYSDHFGELFSESIVKIAGEYFRYPHGYYSDGRPWINVDEVEKVYPKEVRVIKYITSEEENE